MKKEELKEIKDELTILSWINSLPKVEFLRLVGLAIKQKGEVSLIKKMYDIVEQEREAEKKDNLRFVCDFGQY